MKKSTLIISIAFSILGLINGIVLAFLVCFNVFEATMQSYVLAVMFMVLVWAPPILEKLIKVNLNMSLIIAYEIFLVLAMVIGSQWGIYKYPIYYDKLNHLMSGVLVCFIFYNLFGEKRADSVGKVWLVLLTFLASMAIGGFWEICEFTLDSIIGGDTQRWQGLVGREVLFDTMFDIVCDFVGAVIGAVIVLLIHNKKRKNPKNTSQNT